MKVLAPNFLARALATFALLGAVTGTTLAAPLRHAAATSRVTPPAAHTDRDFGKVPLSFEPNQGQTDAKVQFLSRGQGYALFLTPGEAVLELQKLSGKKANAAQARPASSVLRMTLVGANAKAAVAGEQQLPGTSNYFIGNDSSKWKTAVPTYQRVAYTAVYPGVDLVYYGNQRQLEYDFVVAPGADATKIALQFKGATPVIDKAGNLVLAVQGEAASFHKPVVYQLEGDRRIPVAGSYQIADGKVGFALGAYDHSRPLVIDPVLSYMTYLGGSAEDDIKGMAVDAQGNVIVVGTTYSTDFPLKSAYNSTAIAYNANYPHTMFVSKLNSTGTALVYSTFLGSSTAAASVAVDPSGNAYVYATTDDPNYPVTAGAYQTICGANFNQSTGARIAGCSTQVASGNNSTVLSKISPDGSQLVYSTFLSGSNGHIAQAVAVNAAGEAYVVGVTNGQCTSAPAYFCIANTANASEALLTNQGDTYGFLVKFNAQGSGMLYSTKIYNHNPVGHYLSGIKLNAIALDAAGNAYVTGNMDSNYFITITPGALQSTRYSTSLPAFVAKFNPSGTAATSLVYSTYLSGTTNSTDYANGIAVDSSGNAIVAGYTNSCTFPVTTGAFSTVPGGSVSGNICAGGFLTKFNATGTALVWSTYTGANGASNRNNDSNNAVALGPDGTVYVAGDENGAALSPSVNPLAGQSDNNRTYIKQFSADGSKVLFSSGLGGTPGDGQGIPVSIFVDPASNIYIAGATTNPSWPVTAGAFQKTNAGGANDGYIVKISPQATTTTALTLPTGTITAGQAVKLSARVTGQTGTTGTPTGTVTFLSGSTTLGTGTLDGTGTATYTAPSLNATTYTITASYSGDTAFSASVSAAQNLVVAPATPTVTLTAPATALVGTSVTLAVTVTGTPGTPTGSVTYKDGTTLLNTATLVSGAASYSTSALAAGAHTITVSYTGDSIFGAATSSASTVTINVAPAISFVAQPTSLTVVHGSSGNIIITGTPVGGYTGIVTFACGTLPSGASCTFAPASLVFSGNNAAAGTTLTFNTVTTVAALESLPGSKALFPVFVALVLLPFGFRRHRKQLRAAALCSLLAFTAVIGLSGCSSSNAFKAPTTITTAAGTYTVPVTITAGAAVSTLNVTVVVQ